MIFFDSAAVGIALLLARSAGEVALMAAFLVGLGMGAEADIIAYSLSRYFGLKALGTAFGYVFGAFVLGGAAGGATDGRWFRFDSRLYAAVGRILPSHPIGCGTYLPPGALSLRSAAS